jgi:hypothetical protein
MMVGWTNLVLIVGVITGIALVYKEYSRINNAHLLLRLIAIIFAVASLICLALPLKYTGKQKVQDVKQAVLVTEGFDHDSLRSLASLPAFTMDTLIKKAYPKLKFVIGASQIKDSVAGLSGIHILGYGLDEFNLRQLQRIPIKFRPANTPIGIQAANWNQQLVKGQTLTLQGKATGRPNQILRVVLKGLNTTLDSAWVNPGTETFELRTIPKGTGNLIYHLLVLSGIDTLQSEPVPVEIEPVKPLKILILASSPDFENRFFKNWLTASGYSFAIRSVISKNKYSTEAVNMPPIPLNHLSASTLKQFDLLVSDQLAIQSLSGSESASLKQEVTQNGLGVIIRADSSAKPSWYQLNFPVSRLNGKVQNASALHLLGVSKPTLPLNMDMVTINQQANTQVLVTDDQGRAKVSSALAGAGKLAFSTVNNTFSWMLAGNGADYAAYWSLLVNSTAKKTAQSQLFSYTDELPVINGETRLQITSATMPDSVRIDNTALTFAQSKTVPFEWLSTYWPQRAGWHTVITKGKPLANFYVFNTPDWRNLKNLQKIFVTKAYAKENLLNWSNGRQKALVIEKKVPEIYFYLIFLMACAYLWAESKFSI